VARAEKPFTPDPPAAAREELAAAAERVASASAPPQPASAPAAGAAPAAAPATVAKPAPPAERQIAREASDATGKAASNMGAVAGSVAPAGRSDASEAPQPRVLTPRMRAVEAKEKGIAEPETPEKWLERIAALRGEGKHDEADKQLAEFRSRHPDYRIPEPMLKKVLPPR
jgi:translation initiation factor IF-2